ncbi:MAG: tRNA nucleotidyltransferase [Idiomarina sp.]|nr:tRNA nucleotidyltransferase [Idiomarina sp.]
MKIYLVGGAVRDELLGIPVHERDYVVVGATPEHLVEQGFTPVGKDFPVFLHPDTNEEYALARTERKSGQGYTGFDCYAAPDVTLEEDLQRRDLTINAIAKADSGELIDPWGGLEDIQARVLRHVSPAFIEDPLRVLRVARFAARFAHLDFQIAPETLQLMQLIVASGELKTLVAERVWQELSRALHTDSPAVFFEVLHRSGALSELLAVTLPTVMSWSSLAQPQQQPLAVRYACFTFDLQQQLQGADEALLEHLQSRLRVPNHCHDLACILNRANQLLAQETVDAEQLVHFLQRNDAWRRPERFSLVTNAVEKTHGHATFQRWLQMTNCVEALRQLSVDPFVKAGMKGAEIGKALHQARLELLERHWGQRSI